MQSRHMESGRKASNDSPLPRGQRLIAEFPRFGVVSFARRRLEHAEVALEIFRRHSWSFRLTPTEFAKLQRVTVTADFHCAAGWSYRALQWSGFRFLDVWNTFVRPKIDSADELGLAILRGRDGCRTALPLDKHLASIELRRDSRDYRPLLSRFLDHPRARVAFEERGQLLPGWLSRYVFRPFIPRIIRELQRITTD
jgi:hypothetical protein